MKKIILCLLVLALLPGSLTALGAQAQPSAPEGYTLVDFNDALALFADFESGNIILSDRAAGYLWRSNPEGEDSKARGVHRQTLLSQITVNYTNERGTVDPYRPSSSNPTGSPYNQPRTRQRQPTGYGY